MFATCPDPERPRGATLRRGLSAFAVAAGLAAVGAPAALAAPGNIGITGTYASPISGTDVRCTPEPAGRRIYGTQVPFDATRPPSTNSLGVGYPATANYPASANYRAANTPSTANLTPKLAAGESNDLCLGFTLTPNVEPGLIRSPTQTAGVRLQDDPPVGDVDATHTRENGVQVEGDDLRNVAIDAPLGYLGEVDGGPQCSLEAFGLGNFKEDTCDPATRVGTAYIRASVIALNKQLHLSLGGLANDSGSFDGGSVFNLEHGPNELGRLGVTVQPVGGLAPVKFTVRLGLTPDGSGRVRTIVENAPRKLYGIDNVDPDTGQLIANPNAAEDSQIYVEAVGIRAWGKKADHPSLTKDFSEWGTDCSKPLSADFSIETYGGVKSTATSDPFTLTGCDALPFQPSIKVETAERRPAVPTATTVTVGLGQTETGPKTALLKDAVVNLPAGLELGAQAGSGPNGLPLCSAAAFGFEQQGTANSCPAASRVGSLSIKSPLVALPFTGSVFLGPQSAVGELPSIYLEATPEGATAADAPRIKLVGSVSVDANGTITTSFKNNPQLRFSELRLAFDGGPNALFVTPRTCGTTTGTSSFVSHASPTPVTVDSSLTIDEDCATPGFAPAIAMAVDNPAAGASSRTTVTLARLDRSPWMKDFKVSLPTGFLADLNSATECGAGPATTGACPESSRIGTVTAVAGAGEAPLTLSGQMYFTERVSGSVAGAVFVVRAKIGELDLGDVIVPARIDLRPTDAGLVLIASAPTRFKGLALNLRSFSVALDRPGFPLNPTACGPFPITGELVGDGGQTATPTAQIGFTNCAGLAFKPVIEASLVGDVKTGAHPEVNVSITKARGESNLRSATVMLPAGVASDPKNLQSVCETAAFDAGACPAATRKGTVAVNVAITSETITGDVYLVRVAGNQLPGLGLNITGRYAQRVLSKITVDKATGRLITTFGAIPDLPITKMALKIEGGAAGPIIAAGSLCEKPSAWDASFEGQGGQSVKTALPFNCSSATTTAPKPSAKWSRKTGLTLTFTSPKGKTIKSAKVTLPSGFKVTTSKSSRKKYVKVSSTGGKSKTKFTSRTVSVSASGAGPTKTKITAKPKGLKLPKSKAYKKGLKKGKKLKVKTRVVLSDGKVSSNTLTIKIS